MTTVRISRGEYEHIIEAHGHTEPKVCHAVTALLESLAGYLENTDCEHSIFLNDGEARIAFDDCDEVFKFMEIAFVQIAMSFPDSMKLFNEN